MEYKVLIGRLRYITLRKKYRKIIIINAYAYTEAAEEHNKDKFHEQIKELLEVLPKCDVKIIGDFNTNVEGDEVNSNIDGKEMLQRQRQIIMYKTHQLCSDKTLDTYRKKYYPEA